MKAAISFMLGLLVAFALVFGWLGTPQRLDTRWKTTNRGLQQIDLTGEPTTR